MKKDQPISHAAAKAGLAIQTLRKYEEYGVADPLRGSESNYRYYDTRDIASLIGCKRLRQMGFSLSEASQLPQEKDLVRIKSAFQRLEEELHAEIAYKTNLLQEVHALCKELDAIPESVGRYEIIPCKPDEVYYFINIMDTVPNNKQKDMIKTLTDMFPLCKYIDVFSLEPGLRVTAEGYVIEKSKMTPDLDETQFERIAPSTCLSTMMKIRRDWMGLEKDVADMYAYALDHGLKPSGMFYLQMILGTSKDGPIHTYNRAYLPLIS